MSERHRDIRQSVSLSDFVRQEAGTDLKLSGRKLLGLCPLHSERTPSFTIEAGDAGHEVYYCHGCGEGGDVVGFVKAFHKCDATAAVKFLRAWNGGQTNSEPRPLPPRRDPYAGIEPIEPPGPPIVGQRLDLFNPNADDDKQETSLTPSAVFTYRDAAGNVLGYVVRADFPNGKKITPFIAYVKTPDGRQRFSYFSRPNPWPLYRLDKLISGQVIIVEGEGCADALAKATGRCVVSWGGGTNAVNRSDWSALAGRKVVIWPDADKSGIAAANEIAAILSNEHGCMVRIIDVPEGEGPKRPYPFADWQAGSAPPKGWDCKDACTDDWSGDDLVQFMRSRAKDWTPPEPPPVPPPAETQSAKRPALAKPAPAPAPRPVVEARTTQFVVLDRRDPLPSARILVAANYTKEGLRTLHHYRGAFYRWTGACYQEAHHDAINSAIWSFLERAICLTDKGAEPFRPNRSRVGDVFAALTAATNLPAQIEAPVWLSGGDDAPAADEFLAVRNGLLHLASGDLYPPTPAYFGLNSAGVDYDPDASEPSEWLHFLDQVWPGDRQSIEALQDLFGYLLSPDTSQQKIALIVGPKRSGKGTIARVLTALLGHDSVAAPTLASLATNFGLAPLIGKSLAIIGDARLGARADQAAIAERLLSISGEDALTIDRKFLSAWTGRLALRFLIMTNELPRLTDASGALASRFIVLTMGQSFLGKEDRGLSNRLLGELPGIMNWALQGYRRLRERGYFLQPDSARDAIAELEALGSPVATFVKERCTVAPGLQCAPGRMFNEWKDWCGANGRKEPGTAQTFGRDLRAVVSGLRISQPRVDGRQTRIYEGIGITSPAPAADMELADHW